jgi:trigger factor
VKTDVEELSPTRVRLTIEVPFDELKPNLDQAYREIGQQVRIHGFRPGHVPRQVLDQRIGRGAVLEQAINDAVPSLYSKAVREAQVVALGQPEVEITKLEDGEQIAFTAEVDVRPKFEIPDLDGLHVVVEDAEVGPDEVEEYLGALRERFASLRAADRPAQAGDYVSIDLAAEVDGEPVDDAQATGISYEVGSGTILDGLDDALAGMAADETRTFQTELAGGQHAGSLADVKVTVRSVKVKDLPGLDDEFAQSASEYNTVGELRANTRKQMEVMRRAGQVGQARDRGIEALLEQIDMPLPESIIDHEIEHRQASLVEELDQAGLTMDSFAESRGVTAADLEKDISDDVRRSVKVQFILDQIAEQEDLGIEQDELGQYVAQLAYQQGMAPEALARQLTSQGQLGAVVGEVLRSKAAALIAERATVTDSSGRKVVFADQEVDEIGAASDEADDDADVDSDQADRSVAGSVVAGSVVAGSADPDAGLADEGSDAAQAVGAPVAKGRAARRGAAKAAAGKGEERSAGKARGRKAADREAQTPGPAE